MNPEELEREGLLEGVESDSERDARIALLEELSAAGVPLEDLKKAVKEERLALLPLERVFSKGSKYTLREAAELTGLSEDFLRRDWMALGLSIPEPHEPAFSEANLEGLKGLKQLLDLGVPEAEALELARVSGQSSARLAEATMQTFANIFMRAGDTERDLGMRYAEIAMQLMPMMGPMSENPLQLHIREVIRREAVSRAERVAGRLPGSREISVCFADLVGFTALGESVSIGEVGDVAERLEEMATHTARPPVRLVKMIGDAAMLVSTDARSGVDAALELVAAADSEQGFPSLRAGMAYGPALPRLGDWYGSPVNLASRITSVAPPSSVLATDDLRDAAGDGYSWSRTAPRRFKGFDEAVPLFRVGPAAAG